MTEFSFVGELSLLVDSSSGKRVFTFLLITNSSCMFVLWMLLFVVRPTFQLLARELDHCRTTGNVSKAACYPLVASYLGKSESVG